MLRTYYVIREEPGALGTRPQVHRPACASPQHEWFRLSLVFIGPIRPETLREIDRENTQRRGRTIIKKRRRWKSYGISSTKKNLFISNRRSVTTRRPDLAACCKAPGAYAYMCAMSCNTTHSPPTTVGSAVDLKASKKQRRPSDRSGEDAMAENGVQRKEKNKRYLFHLCWCTFFCSAHSRTARNVAASVESLGRLLVYYHQADGQNTRRVPSRWSIRSMWTRLLILLRLTVRIFFFFCQK